MIWKYCLSMHISLNFKKKLSPCHSICNFQSLRPNIFLIRSIFLLRWNFLLKSYIKWEHKCFLFQTLVLLHLKVCNVHILLFRSIFYWIIYLAKRLKIMQFLCWVNEVINERRFLKFSRFFIRRRNCGWANIRKLILVA